MNRQSKHILKLQIRSLYHQYQPGITENMDHHLSHIKKKKGYNKRKIKEMENIMVHKLTAGSFFGSNIVSSI